MGDINLLDSIQEEIREKRKARIRRILWVMPIILVVIVMCSIYGLFVMNINKMEDKIVSINIDRDKLMEAKNLEVQIGQLEQLKYIYKGITEANLSVDQVALFDNFNKIFPKDVYISEYTLDYNGKCNMYGKAKYEKNLGYLVNNLKNHKMFKNIQVTYIEYEEAISEITEGEENQAAEGVYSFQLTFDIEG